MQLQLRFEETVPADTGAVWAELGDEQRLEVVETLARVMAKTGWGSDEERGGSDEEKAGRGGEVDDE